MRFWPRQFFVQGKNQHFNKILNQAASSRSLPFVQASCHASAVPLAEEKPSLKIPFATISWLSQFFIPLGRTSVRSRCTTRGATLSWRFETAKASFDPILKAFAILVCDSHS